MAKIIQIIMFCIMLVASGCVATRMRPICREVTWQASFKRAFIIGTIAQRRDQFQSIGWIGKSEAEVLALLGQPDSAWDPSPDGSTNYGWARRMPTDVGQEYYFCVSFKNRKVVKTDQGWQR